MNRSGGQHASAYHHDPRRVPGLLSLLAAFLLFACLLAACSKPVPIHHYSLHGEVVRLDGQDHIAAIRHNKIEGYMEAMTMQFHVKDPKEFARLTAAECIEATVFVQGDSFWIGEIKPAQAEPGKCVAPRPQTNPATPDSSTPGAP